MLKKPCSNKIAFSIIELSIAIVIIGILVAGVLTGSKLLTKSRISAARTLTISSSVSSIKDLVLWLEPTLETSFYGTTNNTNITDGEAISKWNDNNPQAIIKLNFTQNTNSLRPIYKENGIGNLPSLYFNGSSNYMSLSGNAIPAGSTQFTIIAVWQSSNILYGAIRPIFIQRSSSCSTGYFGIATASTVLMGWSANCADTASNLSIANQSNYASIYRLDNSQTNNVTLYSNGTKYGPVAKSLTTTLGTATEADIGYGFGLGGASYFKGFISEIIVYSRALTTSEINDIRSYLTQKYGFSA